MSGIPQTQTQFACEVREVYSGDDLVAMVDLGVLNLYQKTRIRLHGVDTPNAIQATEDTPAGAVRREIRMLTRGKKATLTIVSKNTSSWVVVLVVETPTGPVNVNEYLLRQGYEFKAKR